MDIMDIYVCNPKILPEGSVSQNFDFDFIIVGKIKVTFGTFFLHEILHFVKKNLGPLPEF